MNQVPTELEELTDLTRRTPRWRTAPLDAVILLGGLAAANWFLGHGDPGWQRLNPTPWLLLPFFLGGRYGAGTGLIGALMAAGAILGLQSVLGNMSAQAVFTTKPYFFLSLLAAAAAGTLVHHLVAGPAERLRLHAVRLFEKNQRLQEEAALSRAAQAELQQSLLLNGAESIALPGKLRPLLTLPEGQFEDALLRLLATDGGVISAAIYRTPSNSTQRLPRVAVTSIGSNAFPEQLPDANCRLADAALSTSRLTTWHAEGEAPEENESFLAAIPWTKGIASSSGQSTALLLINRMDFGAITWENLGRIEAIFQWAMARQDSEAQDLTGEGLTGPFPILPRTQFQQRVAEASSLEQQWNLPGQVILFAVDPEAPIEILEEFGSRLISAVGPGRLIGAVGDGQTSPPALGVITPAISIELARQEGEQLMAKTGVNAGPIRYHAVDLEEAVRLLADSASPTTQSHASAPPVADEPEERPTPVSSSSAPSQESSDTSE